MRDTLLYNGQWVVVRWGMGARTANKILRSGLVDCLVTRPVRCTERMSVRRSRAPEKKKDPQERRPAMSRRETHGTANWQQRRPVFHNTSATGFPLEQSGEGQPQPEAIRDAMSQKKQTDEDSTEETDKKNLQAAAHLEGGTTAGLHSVSVYHTKRLMSLAAGTR